MLPTLCALCGYKITKGSPFHRDVSNVYFHWECHMKQTIVINAPDPNFRTQAWASMFDLDTPHAARVAYADAQRTLEQMEALAKRDGFQLVLHPTKECQLCGQHISDGLPCGCGARPVKTWHGR